MTNNTPSGAKKHHKSTEPESCQTKINVFLSSSSSSDGLVQICVTLSRWFSHKTAAFSTEQRTSPSLFLCLKSHEAVWTTHWRTMASFATPFFFMCMHVHKSHQWKRKIAELEKSWCAGSVEEILVWSMILQLILYRKPVRRDLLLGNRWQTSAQTCSTARKKWHKQE